MLLRVNDLSVRYPGFTLHPLSFSLDQGEILSIIGESGSGKTTLAKAVTCLIGDEGVVSGTVELENCDLVSMPERLRKKLRMESFSIAFQNSAGYLNPTMTLRAQLQEVLDRKYLRRDQEALMQTLMEEVGLASADLERYPRELSGGMAQKFLLASAVALKPKLVILDEPTSSLDSVSGQEFAALVRHLNQEHSIAFLVITHDMALAAQLSRRMLVLYEGHVLEEGETNQLLDQPRHPYTRGLLHASIGLNLAKDIWGIPYLREPSQRHGCPFYDRCTQSIDCCAAEPPMLQEDGTGRRIACHRGGIVRVLEGDGISKSYGRQVVLKDCSLVIHSGEVISLVGASGVGKTTLARILSGFDDGVYEGQVRFAGEIADFTKLHKMTGGIQMVFQDSEDALNPRMTVSEALSEPLLLAKESEETRRMRVQEALHDVGLPGGDFLEKPVKALSGGQKQRVSLARALTMDPALLIADEPTSMLDPSSCANVLRLLKGMQNHRGFSMLIVTHDLGSAVKISDSIYLLKEGSLRRINPSDYVTTNLDVLLK